jgi:hypothetical protein
MTKAKYEHHYTMTEALAIADQPHPRPKGDGRVSQESGDPKWHGTRNWDAAKLLAERGDQEAHRKIDEQARRLAMKLGSLVNAPQWRRAMHVTGGQVDPARYAVGEPQCAVNFRRNSAPLKIVKLLCPINATADFGADILAARGAGMYIVCRALELKGFSVGLTVAAYNHIYYRRENTSLFTVCIKQPGQFIDPARAAYWITHPAAFRRHMWRLREDQEEQELKDMDIIDGGYGTSTSTPEETWRAAGYHFAWRALDDSRLKTTEEIIKEAADGLRPLGIDLSLDGIAELLKAA